MFQPKVREESDLVFFQKRESNPCIVQGIQYAGIVVNAMKESAYSGVVLVMNVDNGVTGVPKTCGRSTENNNPSCTPNRATKALCGHPKAASSSPKAPFCYISREATNSCRSSAS